VDESSASLPLIDLTDAELREYLQVLYDACRTGREFELFLFLLLSGMGLEDVSVTRYSGDKGIDLTARRAGISGDRFDEVRYVVQAKRLDPERTVPIESVRALRGVLNATSRGMFITTGRFSDGAERFAGEDPARPIVLIDGMKLVSTCISLRVGFRFRPVLEQDHLQRQISALPVETPPSAESAGKRTFLKTITANDIRARIISLPWEMDELLPAPGNTLRIQFLPHIAPKEYSYRRDRRYIAGITDVLRQLGLLGAGNERYPKRAEWSIAPDGLITVRVAEGAPAI
jgi:hypothetical protein